MGAVSELSRRFEKLIGLERYLGIIGNITEDKCKTRKDQNEEKE